MKRKAHILVLSPLYPPHTGGLENHAQQWNRHMADRGYRIIVWTPHITKNTPAEESEHKHVRIIRFPAFEIIPNYPLPKIWHPRFWHQAMKIYKSTRRTNYDLQITNYIIFSRTRFFITSPMAYVFAKITNARWIHIEHGSDYVQSTSKIISNIARWYDHTIGRFVLQTADTVIANSNASASFVRTLAPNKNVHVIYRGMEIERIRNIAADASVKRLHPEPIITFVGRLIDGKGVLDLLKALKNVERAPFHCYVIGDGPQKTELITYSNTHHLTKRVTFLGDTPWEKAIAIMKTSDIIVNPSYTEGLPTSVIEAALCKKHIIATDVGGTPEILTDYPAQTLIQPGNIQVLTHAMQAHLNHTAQAAKPNNHNTVHITERFDWHRNIDKYEQILQDHQFDI